jgi:hypothetical protein
MDTGDPGSRTAPGPPRGLTAAPDSTPRTEANPGSHPARPTTPAPNRRPHQDQLSGLTITRETVRLAAEAVWLVCSYAPSDGKSPRSRKTAVRVPSGVPDFAESITARS